MGLFFQFFSGKILYCFVDQTQFVLILFTVDSVHCCSVHYVLFIVDFFLNLVQFFVKNKSQLLNGSSVNRTKKKIDF